MNTTINNNEEEFTLQRQQYLLIKLALDQFGVNPDQLSRSEYSKLMVDAKALSDIQNLICHSPESALIYISDHQVEEAIAKLIEQSGDATQFQLTMNKHRLTRTSIKACLQEDLLCEQVLANVSANVPAMDMNMARQYYFKNLAKFSRSRMWKISHILITVNNDFSENTRPVVQSRIKKLYREATVDNFGQLALKNSECPSALEGGELGWCEAGKLFGEIEAVLQWLPKQIVSAPIETEAGFHLVVCHEEKAARVASFEEALPSIEQLHNERAQRYLQKQWIENIRRRSQSAIK
ncbi:peptidylprolyl isomerase [Vibrio sp. AK197]